MRILVEQSGPEFTIALERAWDSEGSFVLLPATSPLGADWVQRAVAKLPSSLNLDHFCLLSSGSTGEPKMIVASKRRAEAMARILHRRQSLEDTVETIVTLPVSYCYSFVNQWLWSHTLQRRLIRTDGFRDPEKLEAALSGAGPILLCLVGWQANQLQTLWPDREFPGVGRLNFAGGSFPFDRLASLRRQFPNARIFNNYGCVEAMPRLSIREITGTDCQTAYCEPLEGIEFRIGPQETLEFRSPFQAIGICGADGFEALGPDRWMDTGDLAQHHPDRGWELLGRRGEVFKRYGEKVSTSMVCESIRTAWPGEVFAHRELDRAGEIGLVVTLFPQSSPDTLHMILQRLRKSHPRSHWPLRIQTVERIPFLPNGKIDLKQLERGALGRTIWRQRGVSIDDDEYRKTD